MKTNIMPIFNAISSLSYSIFLYHHHMIIDILKMHNPKELVCHLKMLCMTLILIIICSKIHFNVVNSMFRIKLFEIIDSFFLNK